MLGAVVERVSNGYLTDPHPALIVSSFIGWLLFLAVCAAIGVAVMRLRKSAAPPREVPLGDPDDLGRLGLSAARPAASRPDASMAHAPNSRRDPILPPAPSKPTFETPRPGGVRLSENAPWAGRAVPLLLSSLSAHTHGPIAVVRHDGQMYQVLARTDGGPLTPVRRSPLDLDGPEHFDSSHLDGLSVLVGGGAWAVPMGDYTVLVAGDGEAREPYLALLADLTPGAERSRSAPSSDETAADATDGDATAADETVDDTEEASTPEAAPVPRAVLIGQEQDAARDDQRPLAFALVTLADAEDRLTRDDPAEVAAAESALRLRLESSEGVRRVEPFGDLLFGAFVNRDPEGMADWCTELSADDPPLFIGAVAPADGEPTAVRDAAAEALRDAYDRRGARIVEA